MFDKISTPQLDLTDMIGLAVGERCPQLQGTMLRQQLEDSNSKAARRVKNSHDTRAVRTGI